jgi:prepilin-type processing-associated H-X9-DG protein
MRPPSTGTDTIPRPPVRYAAEATMRTFLCPSAEPQGVTALLTVNYSVPADANYNFTGTAAPGGHVFSSAPGRLTMGRSHYIGVAGEFRRVSGTINYAVYRGLLHYKSETSIGRVPDGTSNTALFMEHVGGWIHWNGSGGIPSGISMPSWAVGFNYSSFGVGIETGVGATGSCGSSNPNAAGEKGKPCWWSSGAMHSGGIFNTVFGDGSVRPLNAQQLSGNFPLYLYICGFQDGVVIQI